MFNQDGAVANPTINISNTTNSFHYEPGDTRSMTIGYVATKATVNNNITISSENAYGMTFIVT